MHRIWDSFLILLTEVLEINPLKKKKKKRVLEVNMFFKFRIKTDWLPFLHLFFDKFLVKFKVVLCKTSVFFFYSSLQTLPPPQKKNTFMVELAKWET